MLKIVIKKVGCEPEVREVENELHVLQEIVGGYIQCVGVTDNILCICNEEGKLMNFLPNFILNGDIIVGDVLFCTAGEDDFESLNDDQVELLMNLLHIFELKMEK